MAGVKIRGCEKQHAQHRKGQIVPPDHMRTNGSLAKKQNKKYTICKKHVLVIIAYHFNLCAFSITTISIEVEPTATRFLA